MTELNKREQGLSESMHYWYGEYIKWDSAIRDYATRKTIEEVSSSYYNAYPLLLSQRDQAVSAINGMG